MTAERNQFEWLRYPEANAYVTGRLDEFVGAMPPVQAFAARLMTQAGCRLADWLDHLVLAAASLGLGTCWIAAFDPTAAREVLGLPDDVEPVVFTPLGYPADQLGPKERKPLSDLVRYERW